MNMVIGLILIILLAIWNVLMVIFIIADIKTIHQMKHKSRKGQYRLCNDGLYHWREDPDLHPVIKDLPERNCE